MKYLSSPDILAIHDRVIEETGGMLGVREESLLQSIAHRPKTAFRNVEQFPDLFTKAAVYLRLNGYEMVFPIATAEKFTVAAAQRKYSLEDIAAWLKKYSRRTSKRNSLQTHSRR